MNFEEFYEKNSKKNVVVALSDGKVLEGKLRGYIPAYDNDPEKESIIVDETELFTDEIVNVKVRT